MSKDIKNKAKGIMNGLEDIDNENKRVKEQKNKNSKEEKNKRIKEEKKKRSFMLPVSVIEKIYALKGKNPDKTLSEIVSEAIKVYYKINKK